MSFLYALYILEKELTERYFDILELDDQGKPVVIEQMDFGVAMFENPTSIYLDNEIVNHNIHTVPAIVFGMGEVDDTSDVAELELNGWQRLY
jgi:hypothetical protein